MNPVRILWPPAPHRAGFAVLDDTDGARLEAVRLAYFALGRWGVRATKTVWAFDPDERSGIPPLASQVLEGDTLDDPAYRALCGQLARAGHEIALHGASAGNNRRDRTIAAFERVARELGAPARTFLCHAKNAENPYWQGRLVADGPLRPMIAALEAGHGCSGEDPASPYYWGDVCRERVDYMALYRTPLVNTLAANPAMPYFETQKPAVRGWFTTTEQPLEACTAPETLAALAHENGLCLVRVHLAREVDSGTGSLRPEFARALRLLAGAPDLWLATVGEALDRLRRLQRVVFAYRDSNLWIVNLGEEPIHDLQLVIGDRPRPQPVNPRTRLRLSDGIAVIDEVPARGVCYLDCSRELAIEDPRAFPLDERLRATCVLGHLTCRLNLGNDVWRLPGASVLPGSFQLSFAPQAGPETALARISEVERTRLLIGHAGLVVRRGARDRRAREPQAAPATRGVDPAEA